MCGVCSTYVKKRAAYQVLVGKSEGKKHLEYLFIGGKIILKLIFKMSDRSVDGFNLA